MIRRRGLQFTSQPKASISAMHKRRLSDGESSSSDSEGLTEDHRHTNSDVKVIAVETSEKESVPRQKEAVQEAIDRVEEIESDLGSVSGSHTGSTGKGGKGKGKKTHRDFSDENRWKKMKIVGSEKEVMVDLSRVQKYVDLDSQNPSKSVDDFHGNFRSKIFQDYSDL
jgi:hypothetical protein